MKSKGPLLIGITGGIGSGKSTVCQIFEILGVPVYYADDRAKLLTTTDKVLRESITAAFGEESYLNGSLNRAYLAKQVFSNKEKLAQLNGLIHPRVAADFRQWVESNSDQPYLLKEAALVFETGGHQKLDKVITVTAPEEVRIARVLKRDPHRTEADIQKIIANQLPEADKVKLSDYIIENHSGYMIIPQTLTVHEKLLKITSTKVG